jgi:hypothetical protein
MAAVGGTPNDLVKSVEEENRKASGLGPLPADVPDDVLERFAQDDGLRVDDFRIKLAVWSRELEEAARQGNRVAPDIWMLKLLRDQVSLDGTRLELTSENGGWALWFPKLQARLWWELFELFTLRPRLRVCSLCGRVFVPRSNTQTRCQRGTFTFDAVSEADQVRSCVPLPWVRADQHRREYKKLSEAVRRARLRHEAEKTRRTAAALKKAKAALDEYRQHNYGQVGRPAKSGAPVTFIDPSKAPGA